MCKFILWFFSELKKKYSLNVRHVAQFITFLMWWLKCSPQTKYLVFMLVLNIFFQYLELHVNFYRPLLAFSKLKIFYTSNISFSKRFIGFLKRFFIILFSSKFFNQRIFPPNSKHLLYFYWLFSWYLWIRLLAKLLYKS